MALDLITGADSGAAARDKINAGLVAVDAETTRAENAEAAETEARIAADAVETSRAEAEESALGTRIDGEVTARAGLKAELQNAIVAVERELDATNSSLAPLLAADIPDALKSQGTSIAALATRADGVDRGIAQIGQDVGTLRATAGVKTDALAKVLGVAILADPQRPGESPFLFSPFLDGFAAVRPPLVDGGLVSGAYGPAYRVTGAFTVARRAPLWLEPGRVWALRFGYTRVSRPSDPDDDTVRCGIACLDAAGRLLGTLVVNDAASVPPAAGLQLVSARFPSVFGDAVDLSPPGGTVLWLPFVETFGLDGVTDAVLISTEDVTDAGFYSPDLSDLQGQVAGLQTAVARLDPLAAGTPGGLATIDPASGNVQQLPMLRSAWLLAAAQIVPGTLEILDNAVAIQGDETLSILHRSPYVIPGDQWSVFAQATLGIADAQVATILAAIGSPAQRAGTARPNPVFDLGVTTSHVLEAARTRFTTISSASMKGFRASAIGDEDDPNFYVFWTERSAPVGGALYGLLLAYLISPAPTGPALSQQAAIAQLTAIWDAAASIPT